MLEQWPLEQSLEQTRWQRGRTYRRGTKLRPSLLEAVPEHVAAFAECLQRIDIVVERTPSVQRDDVVNFKILLQQRAAHGAAPFLLCISTAAYRQLFGSTDNTGLLKPN